jgi:anti-anti-sigma factor
VNREASLSAILVRHGTVLHMHLSGELDLGTVADFAASLPQPRAGEVLLADLRDVEFIDSSGVHVLMSLDVAARREGWSLVLVRGAPDVQRVLDACRVDYRIRMIDSPGEIAPAID